MINKSYFILNQIFPSFLNPQLTSLTFEDLQFSPIMISSLLNVLSLQNDPSSKGSSNAKIETLTFSNTDFGKTVFKPFFENQELIPAFQTIHTFSITNDKTLFDSHQLTVLFDFLFQTNITCLNIQSTNTDIAEFFSLLANTQSKLEIIDLSRNVCSKTFTGQMLYVFWYFFSIMGQQYFNQCKKE